MNFVIEGDIFLSSLASDKKILNLYEDLYKNQLRYTDKLIENLKRDYSQTIIINHLVAIVPQTPSLSAVSNDQFDELLSLNIEETDLITSVNKKIGINRTCHEVLTSLIKQNEENFEIAKVYFPNTPEKSS